MDQGNTAVAEQSMEAAAPISFEPPSNVHEISVRQLVRGDTDHGDAPILTEALFITPDIAQALLTENLFLRQRKMRELNLSRLSRAMRNNDFKPGSDIHLAVMGKDYYLLNGQHRMTAVVRSGEGQWFAVVYHPVRSESEVATLYTVFDMQAKRTVNDILRAQDVANDLDIKPKELKHFNASARMIATGFDTDNMRAEQFNDQDSVLDLMHDFRNDIIAFLTSIEGGVERVFMRLHGSPVMAVALVTVHYQREKAEVFWREVARDDGLRQGDPRKVLVELLKNTPLNHEKRPSYARMVAYCWNCSFEGKEIVRLAPVRNEAPIVIKGTPYDGSGFIYYTDDQVFRRFRPNAESSIEQMLKSGEDISSPENRESPSEPVSDLVEA